MTLPYLPKLLCLCLASFFLIHLALALAITLATRAALRIAARIKPALAARFLLFLRLIPAGFGVVLVAGVCIPSYLWLEPRTATSEEVGWLCLTFSVLTVLLWVVSIRRGWVAITRSIRYLHRCQRNGLRTELPGERRPAWVVEEPAGLFAMAGIIRPRLLISRQVVNALSGDQLAVALRHEGAHWTSRDNLKRLVLLLAPDLLPFFPGFQTLERGWVKYTERAADDRAVAGDASRALSLATALVGVSRLGIAPNASTLVTPLLAPDDDLPARVERLLSATTPADNAPVSWGCLMAGATVMFSAGMFLLPVLLYPAHRLLEHLIR
jgi:Zn-dependent protease with chaperone function